MISPLSIKKQEFNSSLRGYDKEEVEAFLEKLADDFEELQQENESIKRQLDDANLRLSEFARIEKSLQDTLLKAQDSSTKAIESTKKQTSLMIKEAEIKASQIIEKAKNYAEEGAPPKAGFGPVRYQSRIRYRLSLLSRRIYFLRGRERPTKLCPR